MTDNDSRWLEKCLALAASDNDAEALSALRRSQEIMARLDMSWGDLVAKVGKRCAEEIERRRMLKEQEQLREQFRMERERTAAMAASLLVASGANHKPATLAFLRKMANPASDMTEEQRIKVQTMCANNKRREEDGADDKLHEEYLAFLKTKGSDYEAFLSIRKAP